MDNKSHSSSDRRSDARKPLRTAVQVSIAGHAPLVLRSIDVSNGGMCVIAAINLVTDTPCSIAFTLALKDGSACQVQTPATVSYSVFSHDQDGFKVGLKFGKLPSVAAAQLARYMSA